MEIVVRLKECEYLGEYFDYENLIDYIYYKLPHKIYGYDCIVIYYNADLDIYLYVLDNFKNIPFKKYDKDTIFIYSLFGNDICSEKYI